MTKEYLDDILASVDAAEGNDRVLDSCEEEDDSDLDAPKPLPPTQAPPPHQAYRAGLSRPGPSTSTPVRTPLRAAPGNRPVTAEAGRGGRMVYQAYKATGDAHYFMVQW